MDREGNGSDGTGAPAQVAVVGLGYWGPNRIRSLVDANRAAVSRICDSDPERLAAVAARYPSAEPTAEFETVIADPAVDAVVIATPVFTHATLTTRALEAGKHVFVEKPLAASSAEARQLAEVAARHDRVLACGHTFLHSPPVRMVKDLLDAGELGELHYISSSRVNLGPYRSDVSVVFDLGPHDFSILRFWLDRVPRSISAIGRDVISPGVSDVAFVNAVFDDGLVANIELSWLAPSKLRRTVLVGSERMLVYEDGSAEPVRLYDSGIEYRDPETYGEYHLSYRTGDIISPHVDTAEPIAIEMVEAAEASMTNGGAAVALPTVRQEELRR